MGNHSFLQTPIVSAGADIGDLSYKCSWSDLDWNNPTPGFRDGLIFRVVIDYRGPITRNHQTSQCWRYSSAHGGGFTEVPDERYTYSRQRSPDHDARRAISADST